MVADFLLRPTYGSTSHGSKRRPAAGAKNELENFSVLIAINDGRWFYLGFSLDSPGLGPRRCPCRSTAFTDRSPSSSPEFVV